MNKIVKEILDGYQELDEMVSLSKSTGCSVYNIDETVKKAAEEMTEQAVMFLTNLETNVGKIDPLPIYKKYKKRILKDIFIYFSEETKSNQGAIKMNKNAGKISSISN